MKKFEELTEEELTFLTEEQIEYYVDLACANQGIPFLPPHPGPKPEKKGLLQTSVIAYEIGGIITKSLEHAQEIMRVMFEDKLYHSDYKGGLYDYKYLREADEYHQPKVEVRHFYKKEEVDSLFEKLKNFETQVESWEKALKEYNSIENQRADIYSDIIDAVYAAKENVKRKEGYRKEFEKYLQLAEGRAKVAYNFFLNARNIDNFPDLKEEFEKLVQEDTDDQTK